MSVVGFDIGNENCVIAVAKHSGIDALLNDDAKRETPAVVSFGKKQRFLGSAGAELATTNPKTTISQIKRLIGRLYEDPSVKEELRLLPFETSEGPRGGILIHLEYLGKKCTFMPVEILGMLFSHLKQMTEKNLGSPVVDCVIGIPSYFTDLQRREYVNAAFVAGLNPLKLIHDCTAVALGYGMYKTDFSNKGPTNVMFVDIGQCDTQVTVAAFGDGDADRNNKENLLESYRSVATDSEVQIISITLQQTEDWLREDGDDESAIVYIGKLEELKKFMDPFENRYKDENARKEATIALQTCIQENRVAADLLPPSEKKEVNNECAQAEEWLNHLSELQDSLAKNTTRIYCLNAIAGITQAYDTRCKVIMRSKPASLPKYDEPVDLDREKNLDDMQADK